MPATYLQPVSPRRRAVAVVLTILVHVLIVWLLLNLSPRTQRYSTDNGLQAFDVTASRPAAQQARQQQQRKKQVTRSAPKVAPPKAPPIIYKDPPNIIWMSKDQFAKTDVERVRPSEDRADQTAEAGSAGAAGNGDSKAVYGPGAGPGGKQLYAAEWYREPTSAELNTYLPPSRADAWGIIACQTVARYHVENCRTEGESPVGSGIATGMRRAAWQFLVIPPRVNGKPQIGAWVRIRIYFTERGVQVDGARR